jgi:hypothetical protein
MEYLLLLQKQETKTPIKWLTPVLKLLNLPLELLEPVPAVEVNESRQKTPIVRLSDVGKQMLSQIQKLDLVCNTWLLDAYLGLCQKYEDVAYILDLLEKDIFNKDITALKTIDITNKQQQQKILFTLFEVLSNVSSNVDKQDTKKISKKIIQLLLKYQEKLPEEIWTEGALGGYFSQSKDTEELLTLAANMKKKISPEQAHLFLMALINNTTTSTSSNQSWTDLKDLCLFLKDQNVSLTFVSCALIIRKIAEKEQKTHQQATQKQEEEIAWIEKWLASLLSTRNITPNDTRDTMQSLLNSLHFQNIDHSTASIQKAQEILTRILA